MVLRRVFKRPTRLTLLGATFLAIFEAINISGFSDNIAVRLNLSSRVTCGPLADDCTGSIPAGKEKLVLPEGTSMEIWGSLEIGLLDYAIVAFLAYTLVALWVNRPIENRFGAKKITRKLIAVKSIRWIRFGMISLLLGLLSMANKMGKFADMYNNVLGTKATGSFGWNDGALKFSTFEWGLIDIVELILLFSFFGYSIRRGIEIDRAILNPIPDNRNFIEKIWGGINDAERYQRTDIEEGAIKANTSFTNLVRILGAAASMNVAAASLDEGNVKTAFNKWKNLTHRKGKQNKDWKGLSESLEQAGNFPEEEE
tara:strand:- start:351 stop:1289 length:939 start_codon:yes stop_codon:yes gene_type:complete